VEPIETASADELKSLQLERLRWSLRHAYQNDVTAADADAAGTQLVTLIKNTIGVSVSAVVQDPDTIERSSNAAASVPFVRFLHPASGRG
jgi:hypothetical protein